MIIRIKKKSDRNQLLCIREDGSFTSENLGPNLPFHDIAHFVAEQTFHLENGFYGLIQKGYTIQELSDPVVIKKLGFETWLAEILTRGLQTLFSGSCKPDQFIWQITSEISEANQNYIPVLNEKIISEMFDRYSKLIEKWKTLPDGETLELQYKIVSEV